MIWIFLILILPYFVIILGIYNGLRKLRQFKPDNLSSVTVSVVIACRNEEANLPELVNDLHSQDYKQALYEIIIVDDNSTDNTFKLASSFNKIKNLRAIKNPFESKKSAIGEGVKAASGKLIITTDADCRPGKSWISAIASFYSETGSDMIIAPVQLQNSTGIPGRFSELEFLSLQGVTAGTASSGHPVMNNGANLAFTKEAYILHAGNLHTEIQSGDDIFFLHNFKRVPGAKISFLDSPEAIITTHPADSFGSFLRQRARWLSKAKYYNDPYTILISLVTFTAILLNIFLLFSAITNVKLLNVFIVSFLIKSIPDFLILHEITGRYSKRHLLKWFLISELIYPFYVAAVICVSFFAKNRWK